MRCCLEVGKPGKTNKHVELYETIGRKSLIFSIQFRTTFMKKMVPIVTDRLLPVIRLNGILMVCGSERREMIVVLVGFYRLTFVCYFGSDHDTMNIPEIGCVSGEGKKKLRSSRGIRTIEIYAILRNCLRGIM